MKKAKIMLAAITVLAVVGGALAFKAKTVSPLNLYSRTSTVANGDSYCTLLGAATIPGAEEASFSISEGTIKAGGFILADPNECPTTVTYTLDAE